MKELGPGVTRAALVLAILTGASQLLGLVRDALVAAVFGSGRSLDAYLYAQGLLNLVVVAFAAPAVRALVPSLSRSAGANDRRRASETFSGIVTLSTIVTVVLAAVCWVMAGTLVRVLAPGFDAPTAALAVLLTRVVVGAGILVGLTDLCAATAQAHGRFGWSGLQGIGFNVVMITVVVAFAARAGVVALAVGFVVASLVRLLLQLPPLRAAGVRLRPRLGLRDRDVREVLGLMPALMFTAAATSVNTVVDRAVGSTLGPGVVTSLNYGWRVVTLTNSLLVLTLAAAIYPAFSARRADAERFASLLCRALRVMVVVLAPVVVVLMVAPNQIVAVLFGRGAFDPAAVRTTATAMMGYAVAAIALAVRVIMTRALFALGDRRLPVSSALLALIINVVGDLTLGPAFGIVGVSAATSLALVAAAAWMGFGLWRRHRVLASAELVPTFVRVALMAGLAAAAASLVAARVQIAHGGFVAEAGEVVLVVGLTLGIYVGGLLLLRGRELQDVRQALPRRLRRRALAEAGRG